MGRKIDGVVGAEHAVFFAEDMAFAADELHLNLQLIDAAVAGAENAGAAGLIFLALASHDSDDVFIGAFRDSSFLYGHVSPYQLSAFSAKA
jgi:hypothetical protein